MFKQEVPKTRTNPTTQSNFGFESNANVQSYDFKTQGTRSKQFVDTPLQPGATRQSYQDSDIFGYKGESEVV